ncbi:MAG: hypothetical protein ACREJQ_06465 [bacterium]
MKKFHAVLVLLVSILVGLGCGGGGGVSFVIITASPLPDGAIGVVYVPATLAANGGTGTLAWVIVGGGLPAGLNLSAAGVISGAPTVTGSFSVTIQATDQSNPPKTTAGKVFVVASTGAAPAFSPGASTPLGPGSYNFSSVNIPVGVTVTITGDVVLNVAGDTTISGTLTGDCFSIEIRGPGAFTLGGLLSNACTTVPGSPPGVKIVADGVITIGTSVSALNAITSDGSVTIVDSTTENLSLTPLPGSQSLTIPTLSDIQPAQGGGAVVNRPIRAGHGKNEEIAKDGDISINAAMTQPDGNDAPAKTQAGACNNANNIGGRGGTIYLAARNSTLTINANLTAGNGGKGGTCTAPTGCPASATAGKGGDGGGIYVGGTTVTFGAGVTLTRGSGGPGGDATANADDGQANCANGCSATATAGLGGDTGGIGYIISSPGTINGAPSEGGGNGGPGGLAITTGGNGKDCTTCPAGAGGKGGDATSTGGAGGKGAAGMIWPVAGGSHKGGDGGDAAATGGKGGHGADCCTPTVTFGGDGGNGGKATATGGQPSPVGLGGPGNSASDGESGGDAGDGGDGIWPGFGGTGGVGIGSPNPIPDGADGIDGDPCLSYIVMAIDFSEIPKDEVIPEGSDLQLPLDDNHGNPIGTVFVYFKTAGDLGTATVFYQRDAMTMNPGGVNANVSSIPGGSHVIGARATFNDECGTANCVQLLGEYNGQIVRQVFAPSGMGTKTLILPPPPAGTPYYTNIALLSFGKITFDDTAIQLLTQ